jgi:hypothetical protein
LSSLAVALVFLSGCTNQEEQPTVAKDFNATIRGKVTYKGEPVPYGFVLFYVPGKSPQGGGGMNKTITPSAHGMIKDGKYEIFGAPVGIVMVVVATDPSIDLPQLLQPVDMAPDKGGAGDPKGGPGPGDGKGPPDTKKAAPGINPKAPPGVELPGPPGTKDLTAEQKQTLRTIHATYGSFAKCHLTYGVRPGEQTHDIELK